MADPRLDLLAAWKESTRAGGWLHGRLVHGMECPCRLVREPERFVCTCGLREWKQAIDLLERQDG